MRYLHVTFLAIFPVLPVSPGGGCVEGRRRGSIPADPSWVLRRLMGVASSELAVVEGRQAEWSISHRPSASLRRRLAVQPQTRLRRSVAQIAACLFSD